MVFASFFLLSDFYMSFLPPSNIIAILTQPLTQSVTLKLFRVNTARAADSFGTT